MSHRIARLGLWFIVPAVVALLQFSASAQDRLKTMPGYERHQKMAPLIASAIQPGSLAATWSADGRSFEYTWNARRYRYDVGSRSAEDIGVAPPQTSGRGGRGGRAPGAPERGRQYTTAESPDKKLRAVYKEDRNLYLVDVVSGAETPITTDGNPQTRVKNGSASWVYGEELDQNTAMWWSPDGTKLAFYRFDESPVRDYYLQLAQTKIQSELDVEAYPKAGTANPVVDLLIYDVSARKTTKLDVRSGRPFNNDVVGHYVYRVMWSPDGRELLFTRTNRRQNVLELVAADAGSGALRVILREEWPSGWLENSPLLVFLEDGRRFIWESERNGWNNLYLYDLSGRLLVPLTTHSEFETASLIKVDETAGLVFYMARDGDNHLKLQLHRVGLDGRGDVRLTDPQFHHVIGSCRTAAPPAAPTGTPCGISPDNRYFVDIYQAHDTPPATRLVDMDGAVVAELARTDLAKFNELGLKKAEMFTFKAADGRTTLHGLIQFPSNFDPSRKYPVLVPVYGGPASASNTARETFVMPHANTEYGFIVVNVDSRAAPGRGRRTLDQIYLKLGQVEIDDMAAGVRALSDRPYIDPTRIGIYGTSYGGYTAVMSLLRHPEVYAAASASSPVTSWHHYDTIYTERYMWMPQENKAGYEAGSAMNYVKNLKGRLMLYYGTADNNVHPSNMMQLIAVLQTEGKSFDLQVGPDRGHSGINQERMMEFFVENLVLKAAAAATTY